MAMRYGMAGRPRPAEAAKPDDGGEMATRCLDVWEWEGGAVGSAGDFGRDPHVTLSEYPSPRRGASSPWHLLAAAGRTIRPRAHWAGFPALGAGLVAMGLRERARSR